MRAAVSRTVPARIVQIFAGTTTAADADAACLHGRSALAEVFDLESDNAAG
jgi:hypothetical protein